MNYTRCTAGMILTKEMQAASIKILTNKSSNCSKISSQMDLPAKGRRRKERERQRRNEKKERSHQAFILETVWQYVPRNIW